MLNKGKHFFTKYSNTLYSTFGNDIIINQLVQSNTVKPAVLIKWTNIINI